MYTGMTVFQIQSLGQRSSRTEYHYFQRYLDHLKARVGPYNESKELHLGLFSRFNLTSTCDGLTDGQTDVTGP